MLLKGTSFDKQILVVDQVVLWNSMYLASEFVSDKNYGTPKQEIKQHSVVKDILLYKMSAWKDYATEVFNKNKLNILYAPCSVKLSPTMLTVVNWILLTSQLCCRFLLRSGRLEWEVAFVFMFVFVEFCRIFLGLFSHLKAGKLWQPGDCSFIEIALSHWPLNMRSFTMFISLTLHTVTKGNKTEQISPLVWSLGLSLGIGLLNFYFLNSQTYVYVW